MSTVKPVHESDNELAAAPDPSPDRTPLSPMSSAIEGFSAEIRDLDRRYSDLLGAAAHDLEETVRGDVTTRLCEEFDRKLETGISMIREHLEQKLGASMAEWETGGVIAVTRQNRITATGLPYGAIGIAYYDIRNRVFQQETEGFDGTAVLADTEFNALGQISRSSRPYFAGTAPGNIQWTAQSYDATGRLVSATTPDGGVTTSDNWGQWIIGDRDNWGQG